jgi:hypothetical protein
MLKLIFGKLGEHVVVREDQRVGVAEAVQICDAASGACRCVATRGGAVTVERGCAIIVLIVLVVLRRMARRRRSLAGWVAPSLDMVKETKARRHVQL